MRSRYSAFALRLLDYVIKTTDPQAQVTLNREEIRQWMFESTFIGLEILRSSSEGPKGVVEFRARFLNQGKEFIHREISKFRKRDGVWYFREGKVF